MNERLDQCCNHLKQEITTIETSLTQVGDHLSSAIETDVDALEHRLKKAKGACDRKREHATQAGHRLSQWLEEAKEKTVTRFEDWKTDREISKLEKDADTKEDRADDAIVVAAYAILEAEVAIVEALKARKIAMEVAG